MSQQQQQGNFVVLKDKVLVNNKNNNNSNNGSNNTITTPVAPPLPNPDNTICFDDGNVKTTEQRVYESKCKTNLPIKHLINSSLTTRLAKRNKKKGTKKIPRPQNAWILYRRDTSADPKFKNKKSSDISSEIGKMWKKEPLDVKDFWEALSELAAKKHSETNPDYVYQPEQKDKKQKKENTSTVKQRKRQIEKKRQKERKQQEQEQQGLLTPPSSNLSPATTTCSDFEQNNQGLLTPTSSTPATTTYSEFESSSSDYEEQQSLITPMTTSDNSNLLNIPLDNYSSVGFFPEMNEIIPNPVPNLPESITLSEYTRLLTIISKLCQQNPLLNFESIISELFQQNLVPNSEQMIIPELCQPNFESIIQNPVSSLEQITFEDNLESQHFESLQLPEPLYTTMDVDQVVPTSTLSYEGLEVPLTENQFYLTPTPLESENNNDTYTNNIDNINNINFDDNIQQLQLDDWSFDFDFDIQQDFNI